MLQLDLRKTAKELDIAIAAFRKALDILNASKDVALSKEDKAKLRALSNECMRLKALRNETDLMAIERSIHYYDRAQAIGKIGPVLKELEEARGLINV